MPGLLANTVHQGYDFVSPYVDQAQPYVEKARNNVPLIDPALKTAEELVPALITRADEFAEPQIEKMRPYVEPRIEQVKGKVAPIVDEGVKKYEALREEGVKYYHVGLEKVEQVKGFKDAKETQIREFTEPRVEKVKEFTEAKTAEIRKFTDPKVEQIKDFTEAKTTQIKQFVDPKYEKMKEFMQPKVAVVTAKKKKMQTLLRVPKSLDLQGLNYETFLGKIASGLEKLEALIDRYMPLTAEQKKDCDSDVSSASDTSCVRINRSAVSIITRPLAFFPVYIMMLSTMAKDKVVATKTTIATKATTILQQVSEKLAPQVKALTQTSLFKKATQLVVAGSEKTLGKEKTTSVLNKFETYIPAAFKVAPKCASYISLSKPVSKKQ